MKIKRSIILLILGFMLLLPLLMSTVEIVKYQLRSKLPLYSLSKYPSKYSCTDAYAISSEKVVYIRDVSEFPLEPLVGTPFYRRIGRTTGDLDIYSIPGNNDYIIARSIFGFKPEIYRRESATPIWLATLDTLDVKEVVFSDFKEWKLKRLWSSKDAALIQDILQALHEPSEEIPEAWEPYTYRVDLLSDQIKGLSFYLLVEATSDGQIYFDTYENRGIIPVGDLFAQSIRTHGD